MNAVEYFFRVSNYSYKVSMICLTGLYWHSNGNRITSLVRHFFLIFLQVNNFGHLQMTLGNSIQENKVWYSTV